MLSIHHCIRVVPVPEGVQVETTTEEATPEVIQGFDICGTDPDPTLYTIQGKPRCIQPLYYKIFIIRVNLLHKVDRS